MSVSSFVTDYKGPVTVLNPAFSGTIATGNTISFRVPVGSTLLRSDLRFMVSSTPATLAQIVAQVLRVRLTVDGETKFDLTGTQAAAMANFYRNGSAATSLTGILPLLWARGWMLFAENQDALAYGLAEADSAALEVTFTGTVGITDCTLTHSISAGEALGEHIVSSALPRSFSSAATEDIADLPRNPMFSLYALHIQTTVSYIDTIELLADNNRVAYWNSLPSLQEGYLDQGIGRTVQTGFASLDFCRRNRHIDALPLTMNDLRVRIGWNTAPSSYSVIMEQFRIAPSNTRR